MAQMIPRHRTGSGLLTQLHKDFDRLLAPFGLQGDVSWSETAMSDWAPSVDVKETDTHYLINADLPGLKAEDIDINMENGVLTIKGKRESEVKEEKENFLRVERSSGSFVRQLSFPESVDQERIDATCHDGVLEIKLPKIAHSEVRKIKVKQK